MYSGTTLRPLTGNVVGAHQKIDRLARANLHDLLPDNAAFPSSKLILRFEGVNGPDAIKRKSPAKDEPWHYFSPFDDTDKLLLDIIGAHYDHLVDALKRHDEVRAAFEAAWLAHAVVDGLTPAHHFPYEEKLAELRGEGNETRTSIRKKMILPGATRGQQIRNNWKMWGPKGLLMGHFFFEIAVSFMVAPISPKKTGLTQEDIIELYKYGALGLFRRRAKEIAALGVYDRYVKTGWTVPLAQQVRKKVIPAITKTVALVWYAAAIDAGIAGKDAR